MGKKDFCCAPGCSHQRNKGAECSFYRLPDKPSWLRKAWLVKIKRVERKNGKLTDWKPSSSSRLCGCHFTSPPDPRSRLADRKFATPTIFNHVHQSRPRATQNSSRRKPLVPVSPKMLEDCSESTLSPLPVSCPENQSSPLDDATEEMNPTAVPEDCLQFHSYASCLPPAALDTHDYIRTKTDTASYELFEKKPDLKRKFHDLQQSEQKAEQLKVQQGSGQILSLENLKDNSELFLYYTGLPNYAVFSALFEYLKDKAADMKYPYGAKTVLHKHFSTTNMTKKPGRKRSLELEEELFITLVRLRLGLPSTYVAHRFGVSCSTFSSIFTAWVTLLALELEKICKMPPVGMEDLGEEEADCFKEFPNLKVIIDCTELFAETPSSLASHKQFYSNYKHHSTVKFLVGMNTGGAITYVSDMYGGRASDKFITSEAADLLEGLNPGEKVMADRGFTIQSELPQGVKLVIPGFKHKDKSQFSKEEVQSNKKISEARVHIERAMRRIKQWQILATEMRLCQVDIYKNIFKACAYLVNFQDPFLKV